MQIDLPIHQSAGGQIVLDGIDTFRVNHQLVVGHIQHLDDACRTDVSFCNAGIEGVATKIVQAVHVQLTGNQLMEYFVGIFVLENGDGQIQLVFQIVVYLFHHHQGYVLMGNAVNQRVLQDMRERSVPDVVH